jgi:hypothetical protein
MMRKLGRTLQFIGLFVIVPAAIAGQILERLSIGEMLLLATLGAIVFFVGHNLQRS